MRLGFHDLWKYDGFPLNADIVTISENGINESIPLEELPGTFVEREYERKFPSREAPATDEETNAAALARFNALRGKSTKVTKEVTRISGMTRREETYARLADKVRGNKWFDENA